MSDLIGYAAAFCTTVAFLPQVVKVFKHKDTQSLSLGMYVIFTLGIGLWLLYGIAKDDGALIAANAVTGILSLAILTAKLRYDVFANK